MKHNSFKTLAFIVEDQQDLPKNFVMSPASGVGVPSRQGGGASVQQLDMQATYDKFYDTIKKRASYIASQFGVSIKDTEGSGQASSGFAIVVSNIELIEHREEMSGLYRGMEKELFTKTKLIYNHFAEDKNHIGKDTTFQIDFEEEVFPTPVVEQAQKDTADLMNNTTNPITIIMRDNPDLTESQAKEIYEENVRINQGTAIPITAPNQPI